MNQVIFRNKDTIYHHVPQNLFCDVSDCNSFSKDLIDSWFSAAPRYTTIRVNTILTTEEDAVTFVNNLLSEQSLVNGLPAPRAYRHSVLRDCLVIPPWQYADDDHLPRHEHEVIVDSACGIAVLRGANVFAPGILGILPGVQEERLASIYADSTGRCKRGLSVPFVDSGKVFVGNGIVKMSRQCLFRKDLHPKGIAVEVTQPASGVAAVGVPQNIGLLQNLPSIVCGHVLSPHPGDKVIDLCAAPGHKTTHLAALMNNKGVLVALDKVSRKIPALQSLCQVMGIDCVKAFVYDSTKAVSPDPGPDWSPPFVPHTFDCVLLDAPCSALGHRPVIGSKVTVNEISSLPKLQKKLFNNAAQLLRPGGTLVYSTCSLTTDENENVVSWALQTFPQLQLVPAVPLVGRPGNLQSDLSEAECRMVQRFGPPLGPQPEEDTIGFFIAKFTKIS